MSISQFLPRLRQQRVSDTDLIVFSRKLASMYRSGINTQQALTVISNDGANAQLSDAAAQIVTSMQTGTSIDAAFAEHPSIFSPLYTSMLAAGNQSGALAESLDQLADMLYKNAVLRQSVKSASVYPAGIVAASTAVTAVALGIAWKALKR